MPTPTIQTACDQLVFDLYAAGITGAQLQAKLGLLPRKPPMRISLSSEGTSKMAIVERKFVQQLRKLHLKERNDIYIGIDSHGWCDFPETQDCLRRSFARLQESLESVRIRNARRKELGAKGRVAPVLHRPANLADILGTNVQTPNQPSHPKP